MNFLTLSEFSLKPGAIRSTNHGIKISIIKTIINKLIKSKLNILFAKFCDRVFPKTNSDELISELASMEAYGRGAEPWEIANIILFLASDLSSYMTGEIISASSQRA